MKFFKITLISAIIIVLFTACTKQDLNEDDILKAENHTEISVNRGGVDQ